MRPRIRTLKPEMWADEKISGLSRDARLLFLGCITMADDEGRFRARRPEILGWVFPEDDDAFERIENWISEIEKSGLILFYTVDGRPYGAFKNWRKHQKINKPNPSDLPAPPDRKVVRENRVKAPGELREFSGSTTGVLPDDSRSHARSDPDPVPKSSESSKPSGRARELFEFWQERCAHKQARFTKERRAKIEARLSEGYTVEQIRTAIEGAAVGAFVDEHGKRFDDIELICRNGSKLESFIERASRKSANVVSLPKREPGIYNRAAGLA